mgnify:CR=1 FL=1
MNTLTIKRPEYEALPVPLDVVVTYDPIRYHVRHDGDTRFATMDEKNLARRLRALGVSVKQPKSGALPDVDKVLLAYQRDNAADGYGRLSGYPDRKSTRLNSSHRT